SGPAARPPTSSTWSAGPSRPSHSASTAPWAQLSGPLEGAVYVCQALAGARPQIWTFLEFIPQTVCPLTVPMSVYSRYVIIGGEAPLIQPQSTKGLTRHHLSMSATFYMPVGYHRASKSQLVRVSRTGERVTQGCKASLESTRLATPLLG